MDLILPVHKSPRLYRASKACRKLLSSLDYVAIMATGYGLPSFISPAASAGRLPLSAFTAPSLGLLGRSTLYGAAPPAPRKCCPTGYSRSHTHAVCCPNSLGRLLGVSGRWCVGERGKLPYRELILCDPQDNEGPPIGGGGGGQTNQSCCPPGRVEVMKGWCCRRGQRLLAGKCVGGGLQTQRPTRANSAYCR